jgi:hypothetical protein
MTIDELCSRFALAGVICAGVIVYGGGLAAFAPRRWRTQAALAVVSAGVVCGGFAAFLPAALPVAAAVSAVVGLLSVERARTGLFGVLATPARQRAFGAVVAVTAGAVLLAENRRYDRESDAMANQTMVAITKETSPFATPAKVPCYTDKGSPVQVRVPIDPRGPEDLAATEQRAMHVSALTGKWIRTGEPDDRSNCHGWVFAGGRFHIGGEQLAGIWADNGYEKVATPKPGDVIVYLDDSKQPLHTGVVRAVQPTGAVVVESKWGSMGPCLHPADYSWYGTDFEYRRSPRAGHLLAGLDPVGDSRTAP